MRFMPSGIIRFTFAAFFSAIACAALLSGVQRVDGAQSGLAYGEVLRVVTSDQPSPQPGNFKADFQAAVDAQRQYANVPKHGGMLSLIKNAQAMANAAIAAFKNGSASTHSFMGNWERTDDPGKQTATIIRPDRHQIIHLDLAKKTYRIEDIGNMPSGASESPPPMSGPQGQTASPQPGSGKVEITESSSLLGPKTIEGLATTGYTQDLKMVSSQSTGSCHDGTFEATMVEYASSIAPPLRDNPGLRMILSGPSPALASQQPGCKPTVTTHHNGKVTPPADKLFVWTLLALKGGAPTTSAGPVSGGASILTERGDIRTLGARDAALFDVPAGFTKE